MARSAGLLGRLLHARQTRDAARKSLGAVSPLYHPPKEHIAGARSEVRGQPPAHCISHVESINTEQPKSGVDIGNAQQTGLAGPIRRSRATRGPSGWQRRQSELAGPRTSRRIIYSDTLASRLGSAVAPRYRRRPYTRASMPRTPRHLGTFRGQSRGAHSRRRHPTTPRREKLLLHQDGRRPSTPSIEAYALVTASRCARSRADLPWKLVRASLADGREGGGHERGLSWETDWWNPTTNRKTEMPMKRSQDDLGRSQNVLAPASSG